MKTKNTFLALFFFICLISCSTSQKTSLNTNGIQEPKSKFDSKLKRLGATVADMKKHVSYETGCPVENIILIDMIEQIGYAIYDVNVCDSIMKYRRTGTVFHQEGKSPIGKEY